MSGPDAPSEEELRGFAQIPRWLQRGPYSPQAKLVYLALSSRANQRGQSWPSHRTLAGEASCSVSTVKRALEELRELGVVTWRATTRTEGIGQGSNIYTISISVPVDNHLEGWVAQGELPIDSGGWVAHTDLGGSSHRATNETQLTKTLSPVTPVTSSGPVDNHASDDRSPKPSPARMPGHPRSIDWPTVLEQVSPIFASFAPDDLHTLGAEILGRANALVLSPTAYVAQALRNDPFEWQARAFDIDAARAERGGNPW